MIQNEFTEIKEMYGLTDEQLNGCIDSLNDETMQQLVGEMEESTDLMPEFDVETEKSEEADIQVKSVATTEVQSSGETTANQETAMMGQNENMTDNSQEEMSGKSDAQNGNVFLQNIAQNQKMDAVVNNVE